MIKARDVEAISDEEDYSFLIKQRRRLKKIDLEKSVSLLANIGVIAGIIFLALETRHNTDALQAQTRSTISDNTVMYFDWVATDSE